MENLPAAQSQSANISALQANADAQAFIGIRRVCEISGFSKSSILRKIAARQFPAAIIDEGNVKRWDLGECIAWRQARFRERDERQCGQSKTSLQSQDARS